MAEVGEGFIRQTNQVALVNISRSLSRMHHHRTPPDAHRKFGRALRDDSTKAENLLWQQLRNRADGGRQIPPASALLDGYIIDFVCMDAKLIIEVDGSQHAENKGDQTRDTYFRSHGFRVMRFWNEEFEIGLDFVCRSISAALKRPG